MKVLLAYPTWDNRWIPYFTDQLSRYETVHIHSNDFKLNTLWDESIKADVLISLWADQVAAFWGQWFQSKKIIVYLRRYEFYDRKFMEAVRWKNIDALIFVSRYLMDKFNEGTTEKPKSIWHIPNGVDLNQFELGANHEPRTNIAFVCSSVEHKNWGLAVQILHLLPDEYVIHHIGKVKGQDTGVWSDYLTGLGLEYRWIWHNKLPASEMPKWYQDKHFILSTSITEGNPNNVIEGMACGLRPVVHNWPGAKGQFPEPYVFNVAHEAARIIGIPDGHESAYYRDWVEQHYSLENFNKIHEVINEVMK